MICKKCGTDIADTSKFCGYCGEVITQKEENEQINNENDLYNGVNDFAENDLTNTMNANPMDFGSSFEPVLPVQPDVQDNLINDNEVFSFEPKDDILLNEPVVSTEQIPVSEPVVSTEQIPVSESVVSTEQIPVSESVVSTEQIPVSEPVVSTEQIPVSESVVSTEQISVSEPVVSNMPNKGNKNNNSIFILIGIILVVVAAGLLGVALLKSSSSSISVLEKAIANLSSKELNSVTALASIEVETGGENLKLGTTIKVESKNQEEAKLHININKTDDFDEVDAYATLDKENITLYFQSTLIDMLGYTSSDTVEWLYFTTELEGLLDQMNVEEETSNSDGDLNLDAIIDNKHFIKLEKEEDLNHYQLIIDKELVESLKTKADRIGDSELKESVKELEESYSEINAPIKLDMYITDSNEFRKFKMDLTNLLEETEDVSKFVLSLELKDLNSTKVEIPKNVEDSSIDLQSYITNNSSFYNDSYDSNIEF